MTVLIYWNKLKYDSSDTPCFDASSKLAQSSILPGSALETEPSYVFPIDFHLKDISGIMKARRNHNEYAIRFASSSVIKLLLENYGQRGPATHHFDEQALHLLAH